MTAIVSRTGPRSAFAVLALIVAWLAAGSAWAAPAFPALTGRVVDEAGLLSPEAEARLTQRLAALEAETTDQLVVVTVRDLQDHDIADYGYQLGRHWGIGQAGEDNGALLIVAPEERKVRIEVGYGLEPVLTDAMSAHIIQTDILPAFREGGFERGIVQGVEAIATQLTLDPAEAEARALAVAETEEDEGGINPGVVIFVAIVLFLLVSSLIAAASGGRGRRRRGGGLAPVILWGVAEAMRSSGGGRGGGFSGGGFGGFSGGGGSFGGGGASGGW